MRLQSESGPVLAHPALVYWSFLRTTAPHGGFSDTAGGRWVEVFTHQVNPVRFVPCREGTEVLTALYYEPSCGAWMPTTRSFDIRAPRRLEPVIQTDRVVIVTKPGNETWLQAGRQDDGRPGINIMFEVDANNCAGQLAAIQLVKSRRLYCQTNNELWESSTDGAFVLDVERDQRSYLYLNTIVDLQRSTLPVSDSPGLQLSDELWWVDVEDRFRTTLVFKSSRHQDACWVPLQEIRWEWSAYAVRRGPGQWHLRDQSLSYEVTDPSFFSWEGSIRQDRYRPRRVG